MCRDVESVFATPMGEWPTLCERFMPYKNRKHFTTVNTEAALTVIRKCYHLKVIRAGRSDLRGKAQA
eukprot:1274686-Pleurochrysis_carterae.AAC.1